MKLNKRYYHSFCLCCGRKVEDIWANIIKQPIEDKKQTWEGHYRYEDKDYFYDTDECKCCENCGKELDDEEINSTYENRGEFWGAPCSENILTGYNCASCGFTQKF